IARSYIQMYDTIYVMCHVPKTAGTSVSDIFVQFFGAERCKIFGAVEHKKIDSGYTELNENFENDVKNGVRLFSGHIPIGILVDLKRKHSAIPVQIVLTVRRPIAHFYSAFVHSKLPETPFPTERKKMTVRDLLRDFDADELFDASCVNVL